MKTQPTDEGRQQAIVLTLDVDTALDLRPHAVLGVGDRLVRVSLPCAALEDAVQVDLDAGALCHRAHLDHQER